MGIGVEYKISLAGGVDGAFNLKAGCGKPKLPVPVYPLLTITDAPPLTFTSPQLQSLSNYKIYGATSNEMSVGDPVSSGEHQGEYVIPVTVAKTGQSSTKNIYLSEPLHGATVYGIHLTPGESDYNIEYLENAVGKTPAGMNFSTGVFNYGGWENAFFMPRPCMLKYDGTVDYYLDPNDYTKRVDISIPEDYKPVNYLKRTGNNVSYINTDIYINSYATTKADMAIKFENWYDNNDNTVLIGANGAGDRDAWFSNKSGTRQNEIFFWNGRGLNESYVSVQTLALGTLYNMHLGADYFAINDSKASVTPTPVETSLPGYPIVIFGRNNNGTIEAYNKTDLTIYNVVIRDVVNGAETITHFLIPAERQSDNQLGLYDAITDDFYPATGTFTKGEYGIKSDCDNIHYGGNAMMEWPKIWYKFAPGTVDGEGYFYVSDQKIDDSYHCWCNLDCNGNQIDHFYTPIYSCVQYDGKMRSICGFQQSSIFYNNSRAEFITYATANNTTENVEWYTETFCDRQLIDALLMLIGKTTNLQNTYGNGIQESNTGHYTGACNDCGLFYGTSDNSHALKAFGMEDWWGAHFRHLAGIMLINSNTLWPKLLYKLTWSTADGSKITGYQEDKIEGNNPQTAGYKQVGFAKFEGGPNYAVKYFTFTNDLYKPYPSHDETAPTRVDISVYIYSRGYNSNKEVTISAGQWNEGSIRGLTFSMDLIDSTYTTWRPYRLANISCKPVADSQTVTPAVTIAADYIDYAQGKRYNMDGSQSAVTLPELSAYAGENTLSVGTTVQPSTVSITGRGIAEV